MKISLLSIQELFTSIFVLFYSFTEYEISIVIKTWNL